MLKVNNRNTRTRCEIWSKVTIKTPERCQWSRSGVFIVNSEHISIVNFEQVNACWDRGVLKNTCVENLGKVSGRHRI